MKRAYLTGQHATCFIILKHDSTIKHTSMTYVLKIVPLKGISEV